MADLNDRQRRILEFIDSQIRDRGYPPSVREIGNAVGLTSTSTVHAHMATLEKMGYLRRDPTKPRAIELNYETGSGAMVERRPATHVPLIGEIAAGTDVLAAEHVEDVYPLPQDFTGEGQLFMLRVRGESMIEAGILDGDTVIIKRADSADTGEIIVALVDDEEATLKRLRKRGASIALEAANPAYETRIFGPDRVKVQGKLIGLIRRY